jgi:hypothetical protein
VIPTGLPARKIPLLRVLWGAVSLSWLNRGDVIRMAGVPLLAVIGTSLGMRMAELQAAQNLYWSFGILYMLAVSWLALTTHRMVLVDSPGSAFELSTRSLRRYGGFLLAMIILWALYIALHLGIVLVALTALAGGYQPASGPPRVPSLPFETVQSIAAWLPFLIIGRLSLWLPMLATDREFSAPDAWRISSGNGWRLAVIVGVLPWSGSGITYLLYRDGATPFELGLLTVLGSLFVVVEVVALSLAYRELIHAAAPEPLPTDPPA